MTACEACQSPDFRPWLRKAGVDFVQCRRCGLRYRLDLPTRGELLQLYESFAREYYLQHDKSEIDETLNHSERLRAIAPFRKEGRILDVGCSTGGFLKAAREEGWEPYGVDFSPTVAQACQADGLKVFPGTLPEAQYPNEYFDVVRLWATLEHVRDPFLCLKESHRILKKGGLALFSVPNGDCLMFKLLGGKYRYVCPEHLYYYSKRSLKALMARVGFGKFRLSAEGFDVFSFFEDWKGIQPESTAETTQRERRFVKKSKQSWYHKPLKEIHRASLKFLEWGELGDIWYVYAEK